MNCNIFEKTVLCVAVLVLGLFLGGCDVHEFPAKPTEAEFILHLDYDTDMTPWYHEYDGETLKAVSLGEPAPGVMQGGSIRYIIRAFPYESKALGKRECVREYEFHFDIDNASRNPYDRDFRLELPVGSWDLMVWSDVNENGAGSQDPSASDAGTLYDASDFEEISMTEPYKGNYEWKDAFRGTERITLLAETDEKDIRELSVHMKRPLARYEFVSTDLNEFIIKEQTRAETRSKTGSDNEKVEPRTVDIMDYRVVFYYVGFLPNTYSILSDKPVDSATGVMFESKLSRLSEAEASVGFDYVFAGKAESVVTMQIGIFDSEDVQISLTDPIRIPLRRSHNTILRGKFLMAEASGGVSIDPDFDGDYNLVLP